MEVKRNICILLGLIYFTNGQLEAEISQILDEIDQNRTNPNPTKDTNNKKDVIPNPTDRFPQINNDNNNASNNINDNNMFETKKKICTDECVPFYQCKNGTVVTSGENLIDIRVNDGPCGNVFLTCCKLKDVTEDRQISTQPPEIPKPKGCGYRNPKGIGFRITGTNENEAQFAEFPWMVSIIKNVNPQVPNPRPSCGGSLIHPRAVITAAHCVSDKKQRWKIRAGEWDINRTIEPLPHQEIDVESVTIHKKFYSGALLNDIAFLYLKAPVELADNVATICLPTQNFLHRPVRCFSTGWGKDRFGRDGKYHVIMKKIDLPVVPKQTCQLHLRNTRLGRFFELHSSFMCAGGEKGKDACNGDGGGPLVCPIGEDEIRYYQAGIVAWGIGCGGEHIPGVYADVAKFRKWIDNEMMLHGLDKSLYINK